MRRGPTRLAIVVACALAPAVGAAATWTATSTTAAPTARSQHSAVWTGTEMIVWGGWTMSAFSTGSRYSPATDTWTPTSTTGAPGGRYRHTALWTGTRMIVWGGFDGYSTYFGDGRIYDPGTDAWTPVSGVDAPAGRASHTAVWTGSKMIVWGGRYWVGGAGGVSVALDTGAVYDPATDSWEAISTVDAPSARANHSAVWTGDRMIVWGGLAGNAWQETGGVYDPETDTWTPTSTTGAPTGRTDHSAVWTGTRMLVWGGRDDLVDSSAGTGYGKTGGLYDPGTDTWTAIAAAGAPRPRAAHTTAWTGTKMVVWGGSWTEYGVGLVWTDTGGAYDPATDAWSPTPPTNAPAPRAGHSAVWAGTKMIVWGGYPGGVSYLASGGVLEVGAPVPADLSISKSDGETSVVAGSPVTYTIVASNAGPSTAAGAMVTDMVPGALTDVTWTCAGAGGATCAASGSGDIGDFVGLPPGGAVTYTVAATVSASASGELSNTALVAAPLGIADSNQANNSATDTDTILPLPDLSVADAVPVREGDVGTGELQFRVSLSAPSTRTVTVSYHTLDGTAEAGADYTADSGDLTFDPGVTQRTIGVEVLADDRPEPHETVSVKLTSPSGAALVRDRGEGRIEDDDSARSDLDGDGRSDIVWRRGSGDVHGWLMNGTTVTSPGDLPSRPPAWAIAAVADFDADGRSDLLWRETTSGSTEIWLMDGLGVETSGATTVQRDRSWRVEAAPDLDGDGRADILWRHRDGTLNAWFMAGTTVDAASDLPAGPVDARLLGVHDLDGDGPDDILWGIRGTGDLHLWLMNGATVREEASLAGSATSNRRVMGLGDLDGDGRADILWRDGAGRVVVWLMEGATIAGSGVLPLLPRDRVVAGLGDFDGNGCDDIRVLDRRTGATAVWLMDGTTVEDSGPTSAQMDETWTAVAPRGVGPAARPGAPARRSR